MKNKSGKRRIPPLTDYMASLPIILQYGYILEEGIKVWLNFSSVKTINDVLRLYYRARCIIAHGVAETTIVEGCLCNFPSKEDLASGMSRGAVAAELRGLYDRLQRDQREVTIKYSELCMLYRFFQSLANRLMVSVAVVVHNISDKQPILWRCQKEKVLWHEDLDVMAGYQNPPASAAAQRSDRGKPHRRLHLPPPPPPSDDDQNPHPPSVVDQDPGYSAGAR